MSLEKKARKRPRPIWRNTDIPSATGTGTQGKKDLDIVAEKDGTLIIVEVKTRRDRRFGSPEEAVDNRKIRHIIASTDAYIKHFKTDLPVRFDILTVTGMKPPFHIAHIEDAFFPPIWN